MERVIGGDKCFLISLPAASVCNFDHLQLSPPPPVTSQVQDSLQCHNKDRFLFSQTASGEFKNGKYLKFFFFFFFQQLIFISIKQDIKIYIFY
ncbi:hypothetical protein GDO81_024284 [Engystomops pustulosus]|uniref:Uncharacterized protein n=1 Tax=Engystomops pustulosus TaxID=76066 RepID=A0AAV6YUA7_ENGPU|nr:hypothetical protein GDO81_024284 [Engystomops pustulosus]